MIAEKKPRWLAMSVKVWSEDDATTSDPNHEDVAAAYARICDPINRWNRNNAKAYCDGGDCTFFLDWSGKWCVVESYPGNSEIRRVLSEKEVGEIVNAAKEEQT